MADENAAAVPQVQTQVNNIPFPPKLDIKANLAQSWKRFKRVWDNYEIATGLDKKEKALRTATFLTCVGPDALEIFDGFEFENDDDKDVAKVIEKSALEKQTKHMNGTCLTGETKKQILLALLFGWAVSAVLTACGAFSDDPKASDYYARTDVMSGVIQNASWIYFPYPGQFGTPSFSGQAFVGFLIATLISILDSIGDYYACARTCRVPLPPKHAVNRGIAVEGFCSFLSGTVGCGHATSTYGGNIGAIGLTKVASRRVFMLVGILYMLFGILGKFSAIFISIPYPVLGGTVLTMIGMFTGVVISNLQFIHLSSNRNLAIIGISLILGLAVPYWIAENPFAINTGNTNLDRFFVMLLGNANLAGTVCACLLDNTIPGSREERGLASWEQKTPKEGDEAHKNDESGLVEGLEVYEPLVPSVLRRWKRLTYLPFMPDRFSETETTTDAAEMNGQCKILSEC